MAYLKECVMYMEATSHASQVILSMNSNVFSSTQRRIFQRWFPLQFRILEQGKNAHVDMRY